MRRKSRRGIFSALILLFALIFAYGGYNYFNQLKIDAQAVALQKAEEQKKLEAQKLEEQRKLEEQKKIEEQKRLELQKKIEEQQKLEEKIRQYLGAKVSKIGLAYYDVETQKGFSINGDKYFNAASTVKVQMNMVLFDLIKEGKLRIDGTVKYNAGTDYEGGTGILQSKDKTKPIDIQTLSDYSIIYSDNIATRMIIRTIGRPEMKRRFGEKVGHTVPQENLVTPNEELTFLKLLYENKDNNEYYTRLTGIMKETAFHDRLDKYVPQNIVAHKIGNYGNFVNDAGIIYTPNPYIIAVYTEGLENANETIAQINKILYEAHK